MKAFFISVAQMISSLLMYVMSSIFFGAALVPGLALFLESLKQTQNSAFLWRLFCIGVSLAAGYFLAGITLILLVGFFRTTFRLKLKEGTYPLFSKEAVIWAFTGSLYLMINYTFIDFTLLTPLANILFRLLGAKLGKNVQFNSKYVFDASLLEIGDNTVIGGGAIINGHIVERGKLVLKKVKIGKNVTVGSHSTIMPGCDVGDGAIISAGAILLKNTKVKPRDVWVGVPAKSLRAGVNKHFR